MNADTMEVRLWLPRELAVDIVRDHHPAVDDMLGRVLRDAIVDAFFREAQRLTPMPDHYDLDG